MNIENDNNYFELLRKTLKEAQNESVIQTSSVDKLHQLITLLQVQHEELIAANEELEEENDQLRASLKKSEISQRNLQNSVAGYRAIAENYPTGLIGLYDHDLTYTLIGGRGLQANGLSREMFEGKRLRDVMPPDVYERDEPALLAALEGTTTEVTVPYNGRTFRVVTSPIVDEAEVVGGIIATYDVTDYALAEHRFKALFDTASIAILLVNQDGSIAIANEKASEIFDYTSDELAEVNIESLIPKHNHTVHQQHMLTYFENPQPRMMGQGLDLMARRKDGSTFPIEVSLSSLDIEGGKQAVAFVTDITQRKQLEADLQTREATYRTLIESLPSSIMIHQDGRYVFCNIAGAKMMGYDSPDEIIGRDTLVFIPPEYHASLHERLANVAQGQPNVPMEMTVIKKDGIKIIVESMSVPIMYEGQPATLIFGQDLTERKQAQQHVIDLAIEREKVAVLQNFMEDASHDFRTPLATIISSAHILKRTLSDREELPRIERIEKQSLQLKGLLEDMFTLLELELSPSREWSFVDLNRFMLDRIQEYQPLAYSKQQKLQVTLPEDTIRMAVDEENLRIAINKILENAINYTPSNGHIDVQLSVVSDNIQIRVEDNGIGISEDDMPHIFKRFFRADKARNAATGSSGLGLSIVQRVIENHGGYVMAESVFGQGSTFTLVLPLSGNND